MMITPQINHTKPTRLAHSEDPASTDARTIRLWEGRLFGGLVLAAFFLYGIGSALVDEPIGVGLVAANSVAVSIVGVIELATGRAVAYLFAAPGGLFEVAVGVHLVRRGFGNAKSVAASPTPSTTPTEQLDGGIER